MNDNVNQSSATEPKKTRKAQPKLLYAIKEKIWAWFKDCQLDPNHFTKRQWCDKVKIATDVDATPTQMLDFFAEHEITWEPISGKQAASDRATAQLSVTSNTSVASELAKDIRTLNEGQLLLQEWYTEVTGKPFPKSKQLSLIALKALGEIIAKRPLVTAGMTFLEVRMDPPAPANQ